MAETAKKTTTTTKKTTTTAKKTAATAAKNAATATATVAGKAASALAKGIGGMVQGALGRESIKSVTGLDMPSTLPVELPQVEQLLKPGDVSNPDSFIDAGWKYVTDEQRESNQQKWRQLKNYAADLTDGVTALDAMAGVAVAKAKLGQTLAKYATATEGINTEVANFQAQQVRSQRGLQRVSDATRELRHTQDQAVTREQLFSAEIEDLNTQIQAKLIKARERRQALSAGTDE